MLELILFVCFGIIFINGTTAVAILAVLAIIVLVSGVTMGMLFSGFLTAINPKV